MAPAGDTADRALNKRNLIVPDDATDVRKSAAH